jgi:hypothetical protein
MSAGRLTAPILSLLWEVPANAAASAGPTCPAAGVDRVACALCAASSPPWIATALLGAVTALAVTGPVLALAMWRGLPVKRTQDWGAILLCGIVGAGVSAAWAVYILSDVLARQVPWPAWGAALPAAAVVLLWGRFQASREVARRTVHRVQRA